MSVKQIQKYLEKQDSMLANWKDTVDMIRPNGCVVHKATGKTAAEIIWEAANKWGAQIVENCKGSKISYWSDDDYSGYTLKTISPQALLVTLQKEQGLISKSGGYPKNKDRYKNPNCCNKAYSLAWATGYAVPDSGGKNHKYKGFYNQVHWAAWQLRFNYERSGGNTDWDETGWITYSGPMVRGTHKRCSACDPEFFDGYYPLNYDSDNPSKTVNLKMKTQGTAALYYYTPHTYSSKVANTYYGNYNFVYYHTIWFGSPIAKYRADQVRRSRHLKLKQGESGRVWFKYKNIGNENWYDNTGKNLGSAPTGAKATVLVTTNKSRSPFNGNWSKRSYPTQHFDKVWKGSGNLAANQHGVKRGQYGHFAFDITVSKNQKPGVYKERFNILVKGSGKVKGLTSTIRIRVQKAKYIAKQVGRSRHPTIEQGENKTVWFKYKNVGNVDWYDKVGRKKSYAPPKARPLVLITNRALARKSKFGITWHKRRYPTKVFDAVYESDGTTLSANQHVVEPGQIVKMSFNIRAPKRIKPKTYVEFFTPHLKGWTGLVKETKSRLRITVTEK